MEIMEDGNLVDRVRILLQRDMQYYQEMQTVLREPICIRVCGGKFDFPRHASFAACKIVTWWEAEFVTAFKYPSGFSQSEKECASNVDAEDGVVKNIQPSELMTLVVDTAEQLLEHLHTLIQECLDHADLTVLTATLGAAALIRNCLWCYNQHAKHSVPPQLSEKINISYKSYHEMAEAVAERLLDLHCRLISLYILNEADSLDWHSNKSFFEKERCSFVIQMWWLYMQGTKADLWDAVSPKMAQRVFTGMLNESLSIIGRPTLIRSEQFWTDAFNVLCCTGHLVLAACTNSEEMIGVRLNKLQTAIRDIHTKCNELLICLLFRGTPLKDLYHVFRNGLDNLTALQPRCGPMPWLLICVPHLLGPPDLDVHMLDLPENRAVILELNILRHQPQPNWTQLMKVLSMNRYVVAQILLKKLVHLCIGVINEHDITKTAISKSKSQRQNCGGFLCSPSTCHQMFKISPSLGLYSLTHILVATVDDPERVIIPALKMDSNWSNYLNRQQVWNQARPPWLNALLKHLEGAMVPIVEMLLNAVKSGASIYQAMSLALGCFVDLHDTLPTAVLQTALALDANVSANCHPIGGSVLLQVLCASLYSAFLDRSTIYEGDLGRTTMEIDCDLSSYKTSDASVASALAEAICSIDEDNKHTTQIDHFIQRVKDSVQVARSKRRNNQSKNMTYVIETHTDELLFTDVGRRCLKISSVALICTQVTHEFLFRTFEWLLNEMGCKKRKVCTDVRSLLENPSAAKPLTHIMFHIEDSDFDQFLTNYEATKWSRILTMPLSVSVERARSQILMRPEFKNISELTQEEKEVVTSIKRLCTSVRTARFK